MENPQRDIFVDDRQRQLLTKATVDLVMFVRKMPGGRELIEKNKQLIRAERAKQST